MSVLSTIPVPLAEAGPLVEGFVRNDGQSGLARVRGSNDRDLSAIAQYEIQLDIPEAMMAKRLDEDRAFVAWVRQLVVLLTDAHAAARWLGDRSVKFRDYCGARSTASGIGRSSSSRSPTWEMNAQMLIHS